MKLTSIETQIIKATIDVLLDGGYSLAVHDGEDIAIASTRNANAVLNAMRTTDEDYLTVWRGIVNCGWVRFIYGNEDVDVINDYTVNLESIMDPILKMITAYEDSPWSL